MYTSCSCGTRRTASRRAASFDHDDRETLRRLTALGRHVLHLLVEDAGRKELLRSATTLADELASWHRRAEPALYGREAGDRP